jgi:ribosomal protein S18 acetylase RimI-like enzyme
LPAAFLDALDPVERTRAWQERLANPDTVVLLMHDGARLAGFCACGPSRDADADAAVTWEIYNLHVAPELRGLGIGGRMFEEAVALGRRRSARVLTLWVVAVNAPARRFYEKKGMRPDGGQQLHELGRPDSALPEARYRMDITDIEPA